MTNDYQETTRDLQTRIDIHQQYGSRDIDAWMLELLAPARGSRILDVGCGSGKQCLAFHAYLEGEGEITGGDVSEELLEQARRACAKAGARVAVREVDFNKRFPFEDCYFDLVSCCFSIYYAQDIPHTVGEMHRVLKPGGRLFTTGPMPENKQLFYDVIRAATGRPIPPMPGSSRYGSHILQTLRAKFSHVDIHIFENPLTFQQVDPFLAYTRASLSEDRKLWGAFFRGKDDFELVMGKIKGEAERRLAGSGSLVMTKVVGGFIATK